MGTEEHRRKAKRVFRFAVVTVSDSASRGEREDESGDVIEERLKSLGNTCVYRSVVPDDKLKILKALAEAFEAGAEIVVTTGGTGITSRDVTVEAVRPLFDKELAGFGDVFRLMSYEEVGSAAILTGATAGVIRSGGRAMVVFCLPGSPNAVRTGLRIIEKEAGHVLKHAGE